MKYLSIPFLLCASELAMGQPNCSIYATTDPCYQACNLAVQAAERQGARDSQKLFDEAIQLCPTLDYAYSEKSVAYLKRGEFITWKKLMDKAVEINPSLHLGYRGWCRYQFLRDYKGALEDFENLAALNGGTLSGYSSNGDYHLAVAKALCYKGLGEKEKAIGVLENLLSDRQYLVGIYDYLHLGVLWLELRDYPRALEAFSNQVKQNSYTADTYYYMAMAHLELGDRIKAKENLLIALDFFNKGYQRMDPYTHPMDKVYRSQVEEALVKINSN